MPLEAQDQPGPTAATLPPGLSSAAAASRLRSFGPNALPEPHVHPVVVFLQKLWGPVPWMLGASLLLEIILGKRVEAAIIAALLLFNAVLSFWQEHRAQVALTLLRKRLPVMARVLRDGLWETLPAEQLVPGDVVHLRIGDLAPADIQIVSGAASVDQAVLTGEAGPVELGTGDSVYAGSTMTRGEVTGTVRATGVHSLYGKTAELVHAAQATSHSTQVILSVVKYLVALDVCLAGAVVAYALLVRLPLTVILPFALIILVASVPVALPATFTLTAALGSLELANHGVLVTRLAAVEDAAGMDVLCTDKTGTLTENRLSLTTIRAYPPHTSAEVLQLAALACDPATQDPFDLAILATANSQGASAVERLTFVPFDPATKRSEALVRRGDETVRVVKGAPQAVGAVLSNPQALLANVATLAAHGERVLAVAAGPGPPLDAIGLLAFADPLRQDASLLVKRLRDLGLRVVLVTGDSTATAQAVAASLGLDQHAFPREQISTAPDTEVLGASVFAGVFPEDKYALVRLLQRHGHVVGMTGDGVNDAPALKQAEVGIAVSNATDVARAAASLVLTHPGLTDMLAAVEGGRCIFQRLLTYTTNKIVKTIHVGLFLTLGLLLGGVFVTTPRLILLLLFANDFVTTSLATDRVVPSPQPDRWQIRRLLPQAILLAGGWLLFSGAVFTLGRTLLRLDLARVQTLTFLGLVFTGQATVYLVRTRRPFWQVRPGRWLLGSTIGDVLVVSAFASRGVLMAPVHPPLIAGLLLAVLAVMVVLDALKRRILVGGDAT